jgi:hypothetical protein
VTNGAQSNVEKLKYHVHYCLKHNNDIQKIMFFTTLKVYNKIGIPFVVNVYQMIKKHISPLKASNN